MHVQPPVGGGLRLPVVPGDAAQVVDQVGHQVTIAAGNVQMNEFNASVSGYLVPVA